MTTSLKFTGIEKKYGIHKVKHDEKEKYIKILETVIRQTSLSAKAK